jgi:hypothetical protein
MPMRSASECTYNFSSRFKIITSGYGYSFFQTTPLSNIQSELLKLFSVDIPDKHLGELKNIIAWFLLDKARDKADAIWDEKSYTDEKLLQILNKE